MSDSIYQELSKERIQLQLEGRVPMWMTTLGWQMFKEKYLYKCSDYKEQTLRIASAAAKHLPSEMYVEWREKFFDVIWKGWLAPSTPVLANMGSRERGCPVSCSGGYIPDNVYGFYEGQKEAAVLSQEGFGTSGYLGDVRPRGSDITGGGKASGVLPVFRDFIQMSRDISQGATRRGAWAGYYDIEGGDFWELADYVLNNPDDCNLGWNIRDSFIEKLDAGCVDSIARYQRALKVKAITGKGYFFFVDKVNRASPQMYKDQDLKVKASNLCTEITLFSDEDHTFTCVLSSMNLSKYDEWKDTDAVFVATVFLDCVAQEFIDQGSNIRGLEKAVRHTEKGRALGLGTLGFHTMLQQKNIPIESFEAILLNGEIFDKLDKQSLQASKWMAEMLGEPEWCVGYGVRNTHRLSIAPNTSSALICGSVSQGIEPLYKNVFTQGSAAGELYRVNPVLLKIMKDRGVYSDKLCDEISEKYKGSVQHVDWLDEHEKLVFKTAFEIDQFVLIRLAAQRQQRLDQTQSLNLFFSADEKEEVISAVHEEAFRNENIMSLYYMRSESGVLASTGESCIACEG